jgi:hypothetical protein
MDDLVVWLRAQLDEDERIARAATDGPWWYNPGKQWLGPEAFEKYDLRQGEEFVGYGGPHPFTGAVCATGPASHPQSMRDAAFIAAHDPARVLRELEANRGIVSAYETALAAFNDSGPAMANYDRLTGSVSSLRRSLELLATVYADRPGYREEWRP